MTPKEEKVLAAIEAEPGIRSFTISRRVGFEAAATAHRLAKKGLVEKRIVKSYETVSVRWGFGGAVACRRRRAEFYPKEKVR